VERRWCSVQHFLFSCKAGPPDCPDPTDLWLNFLDLLSATAAAAARVHQALHVDSFDPSDVPCSCHGFCIPSASCQLVPHPSNTLWAFALCTGGGYVCAAVCSAFACYNLLVGASVAAAAVPACERVFADSDVNRCLCPSSRVDRCCPPLLPPLRGCRGRSPPGVRRGPRFFLSGCDLLGNGCKL
jgi:hypothetical protein